MMGRPRKQHLVIEGQDCKECPMCDQWKPVAEFHRARSSWDGRQGVCIQCKRINRRPAPRNYIIRRHGITEEQYQQILEDQQHACAICRTSIPTGNGTWHIDHDHSCCPGNASCGKCVRGLLCNRCNAGLGYFKDDPTRLVSAINYLDKGVINVG